MPQLLKYNDADFASQFLALVNDRRESDSDVSAVVSAIIADVRSRGDAALFEYTKTFDAIDLNAASVAIGGHEVDAALAACDAESLAALELAARRIRHFHDLQKPVDVHSEDNGSTSGYRWSAIDAVGLYVPGGKAAYPSSVLMNAIPASVAGCARVVMVTPTPFGQINPLVLAAARLGGITEIYRVGGAQAIAALAYGTHSIAAVDKITGPGNAYVAEAKRQVFGRVGIDMIAGPSEILVVADGRNKPDWIAADLLSQAEHDATAQSILITDDVTFAEVVLETIELILPRLSTQDTARASWQRYGAIIIVEHLDHAAALVNALAPEHVELCIDNPQAMMSHIRHAGSIFLGRHTPEAIGDYIGGPNHVLPTGRRARFSSGLGVSDFMKRTTYLDATDALTDIGPAAVTLATCEGLPAHALAVKLRL